MSTPPTPELIDGRYRLAEVLGTGGAAVVRRAHDERLGRDVAVKLFHPGTADEQRQSSELSLMASLAHPTLVRMYDGGRTRGWNGARSTYLVMEYVSGPTLRRALDAGPLSPTDTAAIGGSLASALAYLHGRGVVHRDVKPANVLMPEAGEVPAKLGDFGVARILDDPHVTATGLTVGTANYLSPEQVRGEAVGAASDVYSLGLVLLEALTGQIAYGGVGIAAALARLDHPPVIPSTLGPAWAALLAAMLEAKPSARPNAAQVGHDLAMVDMGYGPGARTNTASADAATSPLGTIGRTAAVIHSAAGGWPESYLTDDAPPRRRVGPVVLVLMGVSAVAIIFGALAATTSNGGSSAPAAPQNSSLPSSLTPATATSSPATRPLDATARPSETPVRATTSKSVTRAATSAVRIPPNSPTQSKHGKAKGHSKHGGS